MNPHLFSWRLVALWACLGASAICPAAVVMSHVGSSDPAAEGWTFNDYTLVGGTVSPGDDSEPFWRIQANAAAAQRYLYDLASADVADPDGWTYTVRVKVNAANMVFEASFGVIEGGDWWNLHLVVGAPEQTGVWVIDGNAAPFERLSSVDPSAAYHTYQTVYDPSANGGAGGVTFYLDGISIGTRARGQGYQVPGMLRLDFGDNDRGDAPSDSQWSLVRFETGQHPLTNDACGGAAMITDGLMASSTLGASPDGNASCGNSEGSPDLWYSYAATCTGIATISTCGSGFDTVLAVYSGTCEGLAEVACNNDCDGAPCGGSSSCVSFAATEGQTYLVRVAGANGQGGDFNLKVQCGVPDNDTCALAEVVGLGSVVGTTLGASADGSGSCGSSNGSPDVWYAYTSPVNGTLRIDTCGPTFDAVVSVLDGCGGAELACNNDCEGAPCSGPGSCLSVAVAKDRTYLIRVAGAAGAKGDFTLSLEDDSAQQWATLYQELFATSGIKRPLDFAGWSWINESGIEYIPTLDSNPGISHVGGAALPPEGSVNSNPALPDGLSGYIYVGDPYPDTYGLLYTQEYLVRRGGEARLRFSWAGLSSPVTSARLALRVGSTWYASDPAIPGELANWSRVGPLDPDALQWRALDYTPGTSMVLGAAVMLPAGDITAFGLLIDGVDATTRGDYRLDNFRVEGVQYADACASALPITDGTTYGSTAFATPGGTASCGSSEGSADVWYAYTAASTGQLTVDSCGSSFDTVLSVRASCDGAELGCSDNACGSGSRLMLPVQKDATYYIRVSGANGTGGAFVLHVGTGTVPNDECANAQVVVDGLTTGTTLAASNDGTASCGDSNASPDVWYSYTAVCNAPLEINTCGSGFDTVLSVLDGCGGNELACNDDACGRQSRVEIPATTVGTHYLIRVSGNGYSQGDVKLNVICKTPPPNDHCVDAVALAAVGVTHGTTTYATSDGDASCGDSYGSPDVWYGLTVPKSGQLKVKVASAEFSPVVSIHQPATCPGDLENEVGCGTPALSLRVTEGTSYLIRVAGAGGSSGAFELDISYGTVIIEHIGLSDPATEGWTLNDYTGVGGITGPSSDGEDSWRIRANAGAAQRYLYTLGTSDVSDPRGWTYTARVKANAASQVWESSFGVIEGGDWWSLSLVPGSPETRGVFLVNPNYGAGPRVSEIDPSAAFHTYQIISDPAVNGGAGGVTYYLDGVPIATQARGEVPQVGGMTRLDFGDNDSTSAGSDSQWSLVRFEIGNSALCPRPFADTDADGDVDQRDFGVYQLCFAGGGGGILGGCRCFDADGDGDVDTTDFEEFQACFSGPAVPADPACND
ncbi:MAG TPA: hypothetical protein PKY77_14920 [Phycisphaerae bacterium]|nr:hypothetical protein [Phycisphaerae bacterium]HRY70464.1 hypothetical protein [Phycisphaerae bacterium]HSA27698.1 hypothetical protein [Phycisphaerae bacterium]